MVPQNNIIRWLRAWLLPALSLVLMATVLLLVFRRWQQLHGTVVPAIICQKLGKEGSGSSTQYYMVAKYQQPQSNTFYSRITTNSGTYDDLAMGAQVQIGYASNPKNAPLTSEWSFSGHLMLLALVSLVMLVTGLNDNKTWRNRRRDGYLPN
ncbi:MAG: hypothetical protein M3Y12_08775 [Bacteroidota bacterium]|nr:hypothetical protein [Bacteroidota bacterium]